METEAEAWSEVELEERKSGQVINGGRPVNKFISETLSTEQWAWNTEDQVRELRNRII